MTVSIDKWDYDTLLLGKLHASALACRSADRPLGLAGVRSYSYSAASSTLLARAPGFRDLRGDC
ncbi:MAG TPA: hypothetical protein VFV38_32345 [Ktedonobacteraceae bacterium]|nr:hypothetical protein [Ktedonobacteraceae bacterium]